MIEELRVSLFAQTIGAPVLVSERRIMAAIEQAALLAIAHRGRQHGWWQDCLDVLSDVGQGYVIMEAAATEVLVYDAHQVPDLLQTYDYARAVATADPAFNGDEQRAHAVDVKLTRQRVVLAEHSPQLARLASLADGGSGAGLSLQVLPFAVGAYAADCGSMTILRFADTPGIGVVHLAGAGLSGGITLEDQDDLARYIRAFAQLRAAALTPAASARLLREMARD